MDNTYMMSMDQITKKLKNATVGIAGLGGLGSNVAVALTRIGIGKLVLVDFDKVEKSNLNRQQYFLRHIGMLKTEALKDVLQDISTDVDIEITNVFVDETNIEQLFKDVDIVVEAFDDSQSKAILVNTVLIKMPSKAVVTGSGMASHFSSNSIKTRKVRKNFYVCGDEFSDINLGYKPLAPRVCIVANHQANMVLRLILGEKDV
ncbi:sulfur carrier protein ThiS adenylyltransferase ThiF [Clostridium sp. CS001]|uniref:sulfur carrier protein ThiS adenylyltransferase ThiF n=1 Tax=Clostridium sp. CS001 TaxID=2880648 RepID=UPI001CF40E1D|nr:sulfur carrier protein ThiS adenylyltransferase ThiF [Clostridium sp. CS001]MCB2290929.1 sulfur carrier protein ThiS adenylyltransferase ThiF [Clostridium sp. CS001]